MNHKSILAVHLVTWNGEKYIPYLFDSLKKQTYKNWKLIVLDNGSTDNTVANIKKEIKEFPVSVELIENTENLGFAGGHNHLYKKTTADYFLLLNQDMSLTPECFANMTAFLDTHKDAAAISPRLMRWDFSQVKDKTIHKSFTDDIDSLGLKVFKSRRVIEKYAGERWSVLKPKMNMSFRAERWKGETALEVFGVSGAFPLLRKSAVDAVAFSDNTFLDESYHSYKEDVDLAFRLRSARYKAYTLLDTVAYHDRSAEGRKETGDISAAKNKKKQSSWVKYHSYKNHIRTLYKNEYWQNVLLDFFAITWYEAKKFFWFLLFDRAVLKGIGEIWHTRKDLRHKTKEITKKRRITWTEIRHWWI
ncbi:MAG: glycosyltransferase family 2 protein [Candidatus Magasanikbacteria bacterium]|uniref:Glycosyltransferase 2-like domain-containing protein n=1 Tax=Candidatus Doudnabacteria bacterium CG10_big_fil_rev_8_21_14_0_10_41_10 TaxID=1974551 RepID=A0A2H0VEY6_9BACT|nr:glycosyltransferase family 2 protein [Candidatus Magasanikbacteria bacterium]NCS71733.1 glycosyltransferase family 2 protein [Candidatus Magasanikbacteria bacterium]PIR97667.1 MAG: hypothetical protein COT91_00235 [Candidatus Doudnabacteria bacterium CG10_big_fil_rev_8_21_14_0_10_41_10]